VAVQPIVFEKPRRVGENDNIIYESADEKILGKGENTVVHPGKFYGTSVAIKRIFCQTQKEKQDKEREVDIWITLNTHDNIIKYLHKEVADDFIFIVMELCDGTLQDYLDDKLNFISKADISALEVLKQATLGLAHLHRYGVIHRDLKPENILLVRDSNGEIRIKIADFGISRIVNENTMTQTRKLGTKGWMPPEVLNPGPGKKAVIVSLFKEFMIL